MDINSALIILRDLQRRRMASANPKARLLLRVASRWVKRAAIAPSNPHANELCYAQALNGALDLANERASFQARWPQTKRGAAAGKQDGKWPALSPKWLNPAGHNIYAPVFKSVMAFQIPQDAKEDLLMMLLSGVGTSSEEVGGQTMATLRKAPAFHQAGDQLKGPIKSGTSEPDSTSNSVVGKVVGIAKNALLDIQRASQRRRFKPIEGDEDFGGDTSSSPDKGIEEQEAALNLADRILSNDRMLFGIFGRLATASSTERNKLLDKAKNVWTGNRALSNVKKKDPTGGQDLMLAWLELIKSGTATPTFAQIVNLVNANTRDPAVITLRASTPLINNDWTKAKELGIESLQRAWSNDKEVKALLIQVLQDID